MLEVWGVHGGEEIKRRNWENCNSIINKIYLKKETRNILNKQSIHTPNRTLKKKQTNPGVSRMKKVLKMTEEISDIETKKSVQILMKPKVGSLKR